MLRILKLYRLPYRASQRGGRKIVGHTVSFSSYPATLLSIDDFYTTSAKLVRRVLLNISLTEALLITECQIAKTISRLRFYRVLEK